MPVKHSILRPLGTLFYFETPRSTAAYTTLVRPQVEYASPVWSPHTQARWPLFQKYFSGLQRRSASNFDTLHHKIQFLTKFALFWCIHLSKFVKIPIKIRQFYLFFKKFGLWKIIPGFRATRNISGPNVTESRLCYWHCARYWWY